MPQKETFTRTIAQLHAMGNVQRIPSGHLRICCGIIPLSSIRNTLRLDMQWNKRIRAIKGLETIKRFNGFSHSIGPTEYQESKDSIESDSDQKAHTIRSNTYLDLTREFLVDSVGLKYSRITIANCFNFFGIFRWFSDIFHPNENVFLNEIDKRTKFWS